MGLFSKDETLLLAEIEPGRESRGSTKEERENRSDIVTGIDVLRRTVYGNMRRSGGATFLAICGRECKINSRTLEQFGFGELMLPDEQLNNLARYLFNGATFNATTKLLEQPAEGPIRPTHTCTQAPAKGDNSWRRTVEAPRTTPTPIIGSTKPYDWFGQRPGWAPRS
jgi:hypothetical protein